MAKKVKEKTPHQIKWGAYKERWQNRRMRVEKRERAHSFRKRTGSALSHALVLVLLFVIVVPLILGSTLLSHGRVYDEHIKDYQGNFVQVLNTGDNYYEYVDLYRFRLSDNKDFFDVFNSSFAFLKRELSLFQRIGTWFFGYSYYIIPIFEEELDPVDGFRSFVGRDFIVVTTPVASHVAKSEVVYSSYDDVCYYSVALNGDVILYDVAKVEIYSFKSGISGGRYSAADVSQLTGGTYCFQYFNDAFNAGLSWIENPRYFLTDD